eukprot:tig00021525_g22133.t1
MKSPGLGSVEPRQVGHAEAKEAHPLIVLSPAVADLASGIGGNGPNSTPSTPRQQGGRISTHCQFSNPVDTATTGQQDETEEAAVPTADIFSPEDDDLESPMDLLDDNLLAHIFSFLNLNITDPAFGDLMAVSTRFRSVVKNCILNIRLELSSALMVSRVLSLFRRQTLPVRQLEVYLSAITDDVYEFFETMDTLLPELESLHVGLMAGPGRTGAAAAFAIPAPGGPLLLLPHAGAAGVGFASLTPEMSHAMGIAEESDEGEGEGEGEGGLEGHHAYGEEDEEEEEAEGEGDEEEEEDGGYEYDERMAAAAGLSRGALAELVRVADEPRPAAAEADAVPVSAVQPPRRPPPCRWALGARTGPMPSSSAAAAAVWRAWGVRAGRLHAPLEEEEELAEEGDAILVEEDEEGGREPWGGTPPGEDGAPGPSSSSSSAATPPAGAGALLYPGGPRSEGPDATPAAPPPLVPDEPIPVPAALLPSPQRAAAAARRPPGEQRTRWEPILVRHSTLRSLTLRFVCAHAGVRVELACPALESLRVRGNDYPPGPFLGPLTARCPALKALDASELQTAGPRVESPGELRALAASCPHLRDLRLPGAEHPLTLLSAAAHVPSAAAVHLEHSPRVSPCLLAWGDDSEAWAGADVESFCEPEELRAALARVSRLSLPRYAGPAHLRAVPALFPSLESLEVLGRAALSPEALAPLAALPRLRHIRFRLDAVADAATPAPAPARRPAAAAAPHLCAAAFRCASAACPYCEGRVPRDAAAATASATVLLRRVVRDVVPQVPLENVTVQGIDHGGLSGGACRFLPTRALPLRPL